MFVPTITIIVIPGDQGRVRNIKKKKKRKKNKKKKKRKKKKQNAIPKGGEDGELAPPLELLSCI